MRPRLTRQGRLPKDLQVLIAPELDDLNDVADDPALTLLGPDHESLAGQPFSPLAVGPAAMAPIRGRHRPTSHRKSRNAVGAVHSRVVIASMAAGAVAAGAQAISPDRPSGVEIATTQHLAQEPAGIQIVPALNTSDSAVHVEELARATAFAQERAQREAMLRRPQFVFPTSGIQTSAFGTRWGTLHAGLDIANSIGTPIYAAADGEVIAAGPTAGYGMWVKIRSADGTVTLYGHIDSATVEVGDRVLAGDLVATMGNRGNSTGPHLHFEVHLNGLTKTDPTSWLRARGVRTG
ncbi:M23 family metallopeptidase [Mycolicibacterium goodii]|nr:M23 family metallopeptidase [Mycolicibacterium goodii]MBU8840453.1 M23 family metallopeptidase [Mycolicibacterium goodii]